MNKNKTVAIIICAGEATRWGNYLNTSKHLIEIEGERLVDRLCRQLKERGIEKIFVVIKDREQLHYKNKYSTLYFANINYEKNADADKFLSSKNLWNTKGRTIVVYGDCYITDEGMDTIVFNDNKDWTLYCRPTASKITGTPWGECFAQSFYPIHKQKHEDALMRIARRYQQKLLRRCGGWEHYRAYLGRPDSELNKHYMTTNYVEINDWSDDFDYPEDYERWINKRELWKKNIATEKENTIKKEQ